MPPAMQMRAQAYLMRVMKDQYLPAMAALPVAWALIYVPHFAKFGMILRKQSPLEYNNSTPRFTNLDDFGESASNFIKRCIGCHLNAIESFPHFAAAIILCKVQKAKPLMVAKFAARYLLMRILYTAFYLAGTNNVVAFFRTLSWVGGIHAIFKLFALAI
mmetsp:Transcript_6291/g.15632  ORF Transcript_6291/g.15632 Transcript_6291/m.15632 type:complete len:160 (-) Transcript_6291:125-604(-)